MVNPEVAYYHSNDAGQQEIRDPEKCYLRNGEISQQHQHVSLHYRASIVCKISYELPNKGRPNSIEHTLRILVSTLTHSDRAPPRKSNLLKNSSQIYLSFLSPLFTICITLYTSIIIAPLLLLLTLLSICTSQAPLSNQLLEKYLVPPVTLQLRLIGSFQRIDHPPHNTKINPARLFLLHLLSPICALGIALAAWIAALFWVYAVILGDPGGEDDDGRAIVLGVRAWWERWLCLGRRGDS